MTNETVKVEPVIAIAREAAELVNRLQADIAGNPKRREMKQDGSFVTEADLRSLECIARQLRSLTPGTGIVAEEQPSDVNKTILESKESFWLVDSLDNTHDYLMGGRNFSINIALIGKQGQPLLGVLIFPGLGELYYTGDDGQAYRQVEGEPPEPIRVLGFAADAAGEPLNVARHPERAAGLSFFAGQKLRFITSRGQRRACMVATGEVALCVECEGFYIWDTAPVAALLQAAGGGVYNLENGELLSFHNGLRLPAYAAAASREIPEKMGLFGLHGVMEAQAAALFMRKSGGT